MTKKATIENIEETSEPMQNAVNRNTFGYITPKADIFTIDDGVSVVIDLPGVDEDGLKVQIENNILTIEGETSHLGDKNYIRREFEPSNFFRQFEVTDSIAIDQIQANLKNGVLSLKLPQAEALKPRNINVKFN